MSMSRDALQSRRREAAACGIGFLASRKGVAERELVDAALNLCGQFDHRGAPGHGAGMLLDIPWALLLDRFPQHTRMVAQRDVAVGMFFLPFDAQRRRICVEMVEQLAALAGADVLGWADVPINLEALPEGSSARRTAPRVRQALFRRPAQMSEDGWFACRYLLRLALDETLSERIGDDFAISSLSNRTIVYRGLADLSRLGMLYPDLSDPHFASRFALFHSRYSTNTTTAWRRAQPFWVLAHNGEISTIAGNVAWMRAIGPGLTERITERHPRLNALAAKVRSVVCAGGSDSANLDDMLIALAAGGLSLAQGLLALLPQAPSRLTREPALETFHQAMSTMLGACDGPAAIVACDGDDAVAHLDRNGLRPLWMTTTRDYALATSELTGVLDLGDVEEQRIFGPGDTAIVRLNSGEVLFTEDVHREAARLSFPKPPQGVPGASIDVPADVAAQANLPTLQVAFGMTREDTTVLIAPLAQYGKLAIGSMGDDTPPAALLDALPRRLDDYFKLRFAQETSPPIDPIRDAWVFESGAAVGDRAGLWDQSTAPHYLFDHRILRRGEIAWLLTQPRVVSIDATFDIGGRAGDDPDTRSEQRNEALEAALTELVIRARAEAARSCVIVLSDRAVSATRAPLPLLRAVARLHEALADDGGRHRVGVVADAGMWDVHHCALLLAVGADVVCPWLGAMSVGDRESTYVDGLRTGLTEVMSMAGVTLASAYCGAKLIEAVGLDPAFLAADFPGVSGHLGGIDAAILDAEWLGFHARAFQAPPVLVDAGEFHYRSTGRPHANSPAMVRALHEASGFKAPAGAADGSPYERFTASISNRAPVSLLDLIRVRDGQTPVPIDAVESEEDVLWRFMVPGMSEGALSEPAHRAVARSMNVLDRYCRARFRRAGRAVPDTIGPIANSGEGGFDKHRIGRADGNRSIQYAGARFTVTPMIAATAREAEVKFAQGAKPGKGGQLPGRKVSPRIARQRGCEPGFELISPPVNHNLYSIEDVKLMMESWRHLNPDVRCALKFVATAGVELVCLGGVNAGANRLHLSDGSGGTGAAKRADQTHAGAPLAALLPVVHDTLAEEGVRDLVELSVDGGVQNGEHVLKLILLGADRVGFGTSILISLGCSMLRQCHLAGPHPGDPTGQRRVGCTPGIATQDPAHIANFRGQSRHITTYLRYVANEVRQRMAAAGITRLSDVVGRRDLLERRGDLTGKSARVDVSLLLGAPPAPIKEPHPSEQSRRHMPTLRVAERDAAVRAVDDEVVTITERLTNRDRCVGVGAAGIIARACGDAGLRDGRVEMRHQGAAGHFYAAYSLPGLDFRLEGVAADSCFTAAYGGRLVIVPERGARHTTPPALVGNTFAYGARAGTAFIAGRAGNRFGICLRRNHEGQAPAIVVEGVEANAFQYMTGGVVLVLGPTGSNVGAGMTGGTVYALDLDTSTLNATYTAATMPDDNDEAAIRLLLTAHFSSTESKTAETLLHHFDRERFRRIRTNVVPERVGD